MSKLSRRSFLKGTGSQRTGCRCSGHDRLQQQHCRKQHRILCRCFCTRFRHPGSAAAAAETGKPSFFTDPYQYKDTDAVQVVTTEVVVVGAGNARLYRCLLLRGERQRGRGH